MRHGVKYIRGCTEITEMGLCSVSGCSVYILLLYNITF
jgi:hypothetical protein